MKIECFQTLNICYVFSGFTKTLIIMKRNNIEFEQVIERGCGLDVHRDIVVATVMGRGIITETRTYDTTTSSLRELGSWLESLQVTDGAMESTGIYWKPVLHVLRTYPINLNVLNDYLSCKYTKDNPVERYALPNNDEIKFVFYIQPVKTDTLQRGIVQPTNENISGGKEVYSELGTDIDTYKGQILY